MDNYIVATIHEWNIIEFEQYSKQLPGNWYLIKHKDELTSELINNLKPSYIFFPHWSWLVPKTIFENFPCVCFHMTDLPFGRGGSPLQNLISRKVKTTKVSALQMTDTLDAGPIYLKHPLALDGSAEQIFKRVAKVVTLMIAKIVETKPKPVKQTGEVFTFTRRTPEQSEIPKELSSEELYDFIRMLDAPNYPKAYIQYGEQQIEFINAQLINQQVTANVSFKSPTNKNKTT